MSKSFDDDVKIYYYIPSGDDMDNVDIYRLLNEK